MGGRTARRVDRAGSRCHDALVRGRGRRAPAAAVVSCSGSVPAWLWAASRACPGSPRQCRQAARWAACGPRPGTTRIVNQGGISALAEAPAERPVLPAVDGLLTNEPADLPLQHRIGDVAAEVGGRTRRRRPRRWGNTADRQGGMWLHSRPRSRPKSSGHRLQRLFEGHPSSPDRRRDGGGGHATSSVSRHRDRMSHAQRKASQRNTPHAQPETLPRNSRTWLPTRSAWVWWGK